jgi:hypothetical protein
MPKTTAPRPFVLMLMPFAESFADEYGLAIKPACDAAGAYVERIDEQVFQDSILARIYNQISKADLIIADLTGRNANVFYETGYARASGKRLILIAQSLGDIPFDPRYETHLIYNDTTDLRVNLEPLIREALNKKAADQTPAIPPLTVSVQGVELDPHASRPVIATEIYPSIDAVVRNDGIRFRKAIEARFGLITPERIGSVDENNEDMGNIVIGPDQRLHLGNHNVTILPGAWQKKTFLVRVDDPYGEFGRRRISRLPVHADDCETAVGVSWRHREYSNLGR